MRPWWTQTNSCLFGDGRIRTRGGTHGISVSCLPVQCQACRNVVYGLRFVRLLRSKHLFRKWLYNALYTVRDKRLECVVNRFVPHRAAGGLSAPTDRYIGSRCRFVIEWRNSLHNWYLFLLGVYDRLQRFHKEPPRHAFSWLGLSAPSREANVDEGIQRVGCITDWQLPSLRERSASSS